MLSGLLSALFLVAVSPNVIRADGTAFIVGDPLIDLTNPAIISVPIGFLGGIIGTYLSKERNEQKYSEVKVRANIGLKKKPSNNKTPAYSSKSMLALSLLTYVIG